ncbi:MAG TPA: hypothetical protein VLQ93_25225, partial [Myxococcaceae bacterium]|nr:hypothetical protein [Myxococcaceae bacterium]
MDTHSLQGLIQRQLTAGGFELPSTVFTGFPLAELLARFFPAGLRLQRASAQTTQEGISLSGYCTLGRSEARAEAAFRVEGGQPHMVLRLSHFPVGWTLADGFPGLEQSMAGQSAFTSVELELDSASPAHLPGELRRVFGFGRPGSTPSASAPAYAFKGRLNLVGRRGLLALLPAELLDMAGPIATVQQVPLASLAAATPLPVTLGPLELALSLGLEASSLELQLQEGPLLHASSHLALRASLAGEDGPPLTFSATSFDWDCSLLSLELEGEVPVGSSLSSLARTLRLPELAEALSPDFPWLDKLQLQGLGLLLHTPQRAVPQIQVALGLEVEWELIPGLLTLRRLQGELYVFEPFQPKQRRFQTRLSGAVDVVGATLQATLDLRTLDYDVRLVQGQQLHLDRLLARCMDLEEDATPPGMVCTLFQLGGNTKAGTFSLYGLVEGDWGLFADMALREVGFAIDSSPQGRTAMVRGVLELGGVALGLEATRERSAASRGWRFEGRTLLEQEVPLGALASELARKLGLPPIPG